MTRRRPISTLFPYTTLFRSDHLFQSLTSEEMAAAIAHECGHLAARDNLKRAALRACRDALAIFPCGARLDRDRKSTRLNSSHLGISYAVFCLKKKINHIKLY